MLEQPSSPPKKTYSQTLPVSSHKIPRKPIPTPKKTSKSKQIYSANKQIALKKINPEEQFTKCSESSKSVQLSRFVHRIQRIKKTDLCGQQNKEDMFEKQRIKTQKQKLVNRFKELKQEEMKLGQIKNCVMMRSGEEYLQIVQRLFQARRHCNRRLKQIQEIRRQIEGRLNWIN